MMSSESRTSPDDGPQIQVDENLLDLIFPFHLVLDHQLGILRTGPRLPLWQPAILRGTRLSDHFVLERPPVPLHFDALAQQANSLFVLRSLRGLRFSGQVVVLNTERLLFLGAPRVHAVKELQANGLRPEDFAVHDSMIDQVLTYEALQTTLYDATLLAHSVTQERDALRSALASVRASHEALARTIDEQTHMVAALSHELRTPIHSLLGCLEVAEEAPDLTEHTRGLLRTMTRCAQHLQSLAEDLTLAYVPDQRMEPETHSICVDTLVQSALELTRAATKSHHVELYLQCPGQLFSADPRQIAQVLVNLISNACKHTPRGGRIRIEVRTVAKVLQIDVHDGGPGISEHVQSRIFDRFFSFENTGSPARPGLGLGLFIAKRFATLNGGALVLLHSASTGSTFRLTLPAGPNETSPLG